MTSSDGGSNNQEPGEHEEGEDGPKGELSGGNVAPGGWVPPEQRAWRHPSETGSWPSVGLPGAAPVVHIRPAGRRTAWATSLVGAGAVAALVTGGLMLATHSRPGPISTLPPFAPPPASAAQSIVRLDVTSATSSTYGCGIVVASDGLIATNATLLTGAQLIVATTASGRRESATIIGVDPTSDVGLLSIGSALPVAHFVDWSEVQPGAGAVMLAVTSVSPGSETATWSNQTIASTGVPVQSGPGAGMASVVAAASTTASPAGAVLMEPDGAVIGILDKSGVASAGGGTVFLPGAFVVQVALEMMSDGGKIQHGWLGINGVDSGRKQPKGALVTAVDQRGASDDRLQRGDVIESIDGWRVRSMADLRSRLYLLAPGAWVNLRVDRGDTVRTVGLALSQSA